MSLFSSNGVMECSSVELAQMRGAGEDFLLLDVRTGGEYAAAHIEPSLLIPLQELDKRMTELEAWRERSIVVMCHSGARSRSACAQLAKAGFTNVRSLSGGLSAYMNTGQEGIIRA